LVVAGAGVVLTDMMLLFDPRLGRADSIAAGKWQATPVVPTLFAGARAPARRGALGREPQLR
jgi:hypothetical protein